MQILILLLVFVTTSCDNDDDDKNNPCADINLTEKSRATASELGDFYIDFTVNAAKCADAETTADVKKNVVVSPFSAAMTLAMCANGMDDTEY